MCFEVRCLDNDRSKMDEDIDELLEEFENKFINDNNPLNKMQRKTFRSDNMRMKSQISIDVDDILTIDFEEPEEKPGRRFKKVSSHEESINKCYPAFIAGSTFPLGCTKPGVTRTCSALYCTNCDFKVSHFKDYEWLENVDYLFLRTNMPIFDKLKGKLTPRRGSNAYACQCKSYSTRTLQALHAVPFLPWFCKGHQN